MIGFLIALVSGALMSIQGVFNTQVTKSTGIWTASAFVQFTALLVCLGAWLCTERTSFLKIAQVEPRYMLLGGAIGAFITYTVIRSMDKISIIRSIISHARIRPSLISLFASSLLRSVVYFLVAISY